jgi:hypothetical protein
VSAASLLAQLRARGISVHLNGANIALRPFSAVPDHLKAEIKAAKPVLLALLRAEAVTAPRPGNTPAAPLTPLAKPPRPSVPTPLPPLAAPIPAPRPYRQPSWSDASDIPDAADVCSCCRLSSWWTERHNPRGWRCATCHPADHLPPDAVRRAPLQGDRP